MAAQFFSKRGRVVQQERRGLAGGGRQLRAVCVDGLGGGVARRRAGRQLRRYRDEPIGGHLIRDAADPVGELVGSRASRRQRQPWWRFPGRRRRRGPEWPDRGPRYRRIRRDGTMFFETHAGGRVVRRRKRLRGGRPRRRRRRQQPSTAISAARRFTRVAGVTFGYPRPLRHSSNSRGTLRLADFSVGCQPISPRADCARSDRAPARRRRSRACARASGAACSGSPA